MGDKSAECSNIKGTATLSFVYKCSLSAQTRQQTYNKRKEGAEPYVGK